MNHVKNNCRYGKFGVHPKNWKEGGKTLLKENWYISYRFYDDNLRTSKQVMIRGYNGIDTIEARRDMVRMDLKAEENRLNNEGYNPFYPDGYQLTTGSKDGLTKYKPFITALKLARNNLKVHPDTLTREIDPIIKSLERAAKSLNFDTIPIWDITLRHLYQVSELSSHKKNKTYSGAKANRTKKVLRQLYSELLLNEVVQLNIPMSLPRKKEDATPPKQAFTLAERKKIDDHLRVHSPRFRLYVLIFFYSGSRSTELLRLKRKDIDFVTQTITYHILKGNKPVYSHRPMLDVAVEFWRAVCSGAKPDDYIFSDGLEPGPVQITKNVIKLRWQRMAKTTGIAKGMYQLKHTHSTEVVKKIGAKGAAELNAESEDMINKYYDLEHKKSEAVNLRSVNVPFV